MRYLFAILFMVSICQAETITLNFSGSSPLLYVRDSLVVKDDGSVALETISGFPVEQNPGNRAGKFVGKLPDDAQRIRIIAERIAFASTRNAGEAAAHGLRGKLELGTRQREWEVGQEPTLKELERAYELLKLKLYSYPREALALECSRVAATAHCQLLNVSKNAVKTVDPLGVGGSTLLCHQRWSTDCPESL